jgi:hypothetical protein
MSYNQNAKSIKFAGASILKRQTNGGFKKDNEPLSA